MTSTLWSVLLIILAIILIILGKPLIAVLIVLPLSALVFIRGNRQRRERIERERHAETIEALRKP